MAIRVLPIHWLGAIQVSNQGFTLYAVKKKKKKKKNILVSGILAPFS